MIINNNIPALNTFRQLGVNQNAMQNSMEKLSSGMRINRAGDDAAGLAISEKMRAQINGLDQASRNAQDGISLIQTAEGALDETHSILQRMRELAVQSANDTNTEVDRGEIQKEVDQLAQEITRIAETTEFNTQNLLGGDFKGKFHIGANKGQDISLEIANMGAQALGVAGSEGFIREIEAETDDLAGSTITDAGIAINVGAASDSGRTSATTELTAGKLSETLTVGSDNFDYALKNQDGDIVALSTDGQEYTFLNQAGDGESLNGATLVSAATIDFGNSRVTSGDVTVVTQTTVADTANLDIITATAAAANVKLSEGATLNSGEYTVVGSSHALVDDFGLVDSNGNLVGLSGDGQVFTSFADSGQELFDLGAGNTLGAGDKITIASEGGIDVSSQTSANDAIKTLNNAIERVSAERSMLGATQNRLEHTINNLNTSSENLQAAESRIRDVDMAKEMMEMTRANILSQASQSMLAQANQRPQSVLQLLG